MKYVWKLEKEILCFKPGLNIIKSNLLYLFCKQIKDGLKMCCKETWCLFTQKHLVQLRKKYSDSMYSRSNMWFRGLQAGLFIL